MGSSWKLKCPYCNAVIARGRGYGYPVPCVWVPCIRCEICGGLMKTGANEYLTMPVEKRIRLKRNQRNNEYIEQSLDRTNNKEYVAFLQKNGFIIYPITNADKDKFESVRFDMYINRRPSAIATQSLYDVGILIKEEMLDKETGGIKKEILDENQRIYNLNQKISRWSIGIGLVVGLALLFLFGSINPNSRLLFLISIAMGFGSAFATSFGMEYYYKNKEKQAEMEQKKTRQVAAKNMEQYKTLIEKCGIKFFIKYYKPIKRLPLRDVEVSENYSSNEREERLLAAKKIIDLDLAEFTLNEILKSYIDILDENEIEQVKSILENETVEREFQKEKQYIDQEEKKKK